MLFDGLVVSGLAAPGYDFMDRLLLFRLVAGAGESLSVEHKRHRIREREGLVPAEADVLARAHSSEKHVTICDKKSRSPVQCA